METFAFDPGENNVQFGNPRNQRGPLCKRNFRCEYWIVDVLCASRWPTDGLYLMLMGIRSRPNYNLCIGGRSINIMRAQLISAVFRNRGGILKIELFRVERIEGWWMVSPKESPGENILRSTFIKLFRTWRIIATKIDDFNLFFTQ